MVCPRSCRACMKVCCRSRAARRVAKSMRSFLAFGRTPEYCPVTPESAAPMTFGALAVPGPPHASMPHMQDLASPMPSPTIWRRLLHLTEFPHAQTSDWRAPGDRLSWSTWTDCQSHEVQDECEVIGE